MRVWKMGVAIVAVMVLGVGWTTPGEVSARPATGSPDLSPGPQPLPTAPSPARLAAVWTTSSSRVPKDATEALLEIKRSGQKIQTFAVTPTNEWVVVAGNQPRYSPNFPSAIREQVDRYVSERKEIDVIAFSPSNQWVIIAEDWLRESTNPAIPRGAREKIRQTQANGRRITSFSFGSARSDGWVLTSGGNALMGGGLPGGLAATIQDAVRGRRPVHAVTISPRGDWVVLAGDWFATAARDQNLLDTLERYRTEQNRRIDQVVFNLVDGRVGWSVLSNDLEPAPTTRIARMERGLNGSSSVYERMDNYGIAGVSIAVVQNNRISRLRAYGVLDATRAESWVRTGSVFEAASISKPISALAALQLVDQGKIGVMQKGILGAVAAGLLDSADERRFLLGLPNYSDIHLADILSHCAGVLYTRQVGDLSRTGAQSFGGSAASIPTIEQMLVGADPASASYRPIQPNPAGVTQTYSGANYYLTQAIIENYSNVGYDQHMAKLLSDLGMSSSTFQTPAPARTGTQFARGHGSTGNPTSIVRYPGKAAASLSTTSSDLARWVIMLNNNGMAGGRRVLTTAQMDAFVGLHTPSRNSCTGRPAGTIQLGIRSRAGTLYHRGTHNGYRAYFFARPGQQWGLVVLMTGPTGGSPSPVNQFATELLRSAEVAYGLPNGVLPM